MQIHRQKRWQKKMLDNHCCTRCGHPAIQKTKTRYLTYCFTCREKILRGKNDIQFNKRRIERYKEKVASKICAVLYCDIPVTKYKKCLYHRLKNAKYTRKYYKKNKKAMQLRARVNREKWKRLSVKSDVARTTSPSNIIFE